MKKLLLLLTLPILALSFTACDKEETPKPIFNYQDIVGTYNANYVKQKGNPIHEESGTTTFIVTGTNNESLHFKWNDVDLPMNITYLPELDENIVSVHYSMNSTTYPQYFLKGYFDIKTKKFEIETRYYTAGQVYISHHFYN